MAEDGGGWWRMAEDWRRTGGGLVEDWWRTGGELAEDWRIILEHHT
jgi:hypothetical protein